MGFTGAFPVLTPIPTITNPPANASGPDSVSVALQSTYTVQWNASVASARKSRLSRFPSRAHAARLLKLEDDPPNNRTYPTIGAMKAARPQTIHA